MVVYNVCRPVSFGETPNYYSVKVKHTIKFRYVTQVPRNPTIKPNTLIEDRLNNSNTPRLCIFNLGGHLRIYLHSVFRYLTASRCVTSAMKFRIAALPVIIKYTKEPYRIANLFLCQSLKVFDLQFQILGGFLKAELGGKEKF